MMEKFAGVRHTCKNYFGAVGSTQKHKTIFIIKLLRLRNVSTFSKFESLDELMFGTFLK